MTIKRNDGRVVRGHLKTTEYVKASLRECVLVLCVYLCRIVGILSLNQGTGAITRRGHGIGGRGSMGTERTRRQK